MILQRHLVSFFLFFLCETCQDAILNNSVFYIGNQRLVESLIPSLFFHAELIVFCLLFYFEVIRCLNIVVPLGGVHS